MIVHPAFVVRPCEAMQTDREKPQIQHPPLHVQRPRTRSIFAATDFSVPFKKMPFVMFHKIGARGGSRTISYCRATSDVFQCYWIGALPLSYSRIFLLCYIFTVHNDWPRLYGLLRQPFSKRVFSFLRFLAINRNRWSKFLATFRAQSPPSLHSHQTRNIAIPYHDQFFTN